MRLVLALLVLPLSMLSQVLTPFGNNIHTALVYDAAVYSNQLYFGKSGGHINNLSLGGVAVYDGTSITTLPGAGTAVAFEVYNNELYMAGAHPSGQRVLKWDGSTLTPLGLTNTVNTLYDIIAFNGAVYASGQFEVGGIYFALAKFDGNSWFYLATLSDSNEYGGPLHVANNLLYLGGSFTSINGNPCNGIAAYNGSAWNTLAGGPNNGTLTIVDGLFTSSQGLVVVGRALIPTYVFVSKWTGSTWINQNFTEFSNSNRLSAFHANGLNFIAAEYRQPTNPQDSLDAGQLFLYTPSGLITLTDSLFKDKEFIPMTQRLVEGIVKFNNQWIVYGLFKKEGRNGPTFRGIAVINGILGAEKISAPPQFKITPNPTTDYLTINGPLPESTFRIVDICGRDVMDGRLQQKLDVHLLPSGVYLLLVSDEAGTYPHKFIKQ